MPYLRFFAKAVAAVALIPVAIVALMLFLLASAFTHRPS